MCLSPTPIITGHDMTAHDSNGLNDPYLRVKLGNTVISRRSTYRPNTNNPEFFEGRVEEDGAEHP
jgi:hypothetical protein